MPHKGVDALYVASQIVVAVQSIVARSTDPMESAVVGIGKAWAGTQYNIVAEEAVLEGTVRTFCPKYVKLQIGGLRTSSKKQPRCSAPTQASSSRTIPTP